MTMPLRAFAEFVGRAGPVVSVQGLNQHLFLTQVGSLRAMMQPFEGLTAPFDFPLQVNPRSGEAPLVVDTRYGPFTGVRIPGVPGVGGFRVLQGGQIIRVAPSQTGFAHRFTEPGSYVIEGTEEGVGSTGYRVVVKTVTVSVQGAPVPPVEPARPDLRWTTPQPHFDGTKLSITFTNAGTLPTGAFRVGTTVSSDSVGTINDQLIYENIAPGQGDTVSIETQSLPPDDYSFRFTLDVFDTVEEGDETNNASFGFFTLFPDEAQPATVRPDG